MNKDVKELEKEKVKLINEWIDYLNKKDDDILWESGCRVFAVKLYNVLYKLKNINTEDSNLLRQYNLVNKINNYISKRDKVKVKEIVFELKNLNDGGYSDNKMDFSHNIEFNEKFKETNGFNSDYISIPKHEYNTLKEYRNQNEKIRKSNFAVYIYRSTNNIEQSLYEGHIMINLFDINNQYINIDGKEYKIETQALFNKVRSFIKDNLDVLINYSLNEEIDSFGMTISNGSNSNIYKDIKIKWGQLLISINSFNNDNKSKFMDDFISNIRNIIITDVNKDDNDYIIEELSNSLSSKVHYFSLEFPDLNEKENELANLLLDKINDLDIETKFSFGSLLDNNRDKLSSKISLAAAKKAKELGIIKNAFESDKPLIIGSPQNIPYIKIK